MATVQDLVADALTEVGVLGAGETLGADDGAAGLRALNRMVNAWRAERVFIYAQGRITWTINSGDYEFDVGPGGDVNIARPTRIDAVTYYDSAITPFSERPLRMMTEQDWAGLRIKDQSSTEPDACWYNLAYPLAKLRIWPVPTSSTLIGVLYYPDAAAEFAALATAVSLPPGYERLIVKNLALEMAPQYGANPSADLKDQARDSMAVVLRSNRRPQEMRFDPGAAMGSASYDIHSDFP